MNSLLGCNRWAWMCSLGKLSVTSVSSKFWWSQPINRGGGGRGGGGWEAAAQPPAKTEAEVFVFGDGIRLALARSSGVSTLLLSFKWRMWLTSYFYTTVRIIWFFSFDQRRWPSLAADIIFSTISLEWVFTSVSSEAGWWCYSLPVYVVHSRVTKQVNSKTKQRSFPKTSLLKKDSFPPPTWPLLISQGSQN